MHNGLQAIQADNKALLPRLLLRAEWHTRIMGARKLVRSKGHSPYVFRRVTTDDLQQVGRGLGTRSRVVDLDIVDVLKGSCTLVRTTEPALLVDAPGFPKQALLATSATTDVARTMAKPHPNKL